MCRFSIKFKIPLKAWNTETREEINLADLDQTKLSGIEQLSVPEDWFEDYSEEEKEDNCWEKRSQGFIGGKEVIMRCQYCGGCYIAEFLTDIPLSTELTIEDIFNKPYTATLEQAITNYLEGQVSDGIGENEIGYVYYTADWMTAKLEVWMDWKNITKI